jgi:hypothetical protein
MILYRCKDSNMKLEELKHLLQLIEPDLPFYPCVILYDFIRNGRTLSLGITDRLQRICRKNRVWKSSPFLTALKNAEYGFDDKLARSPGGQDGIFLVDRAFQPRNAMQRKLFDRYLDHPDSDVIFVAEALNTSVDQLQAVRLVSHHMRLLGVLWREHEADWLILVDNDLS